MKRLSKLLLVVLLAFVCACPFVGCKKSDGDWVEIYSITYSSEKQTNTLKSKFIPTGRIIEYYPTLPDGEEFRIYSEEDFINRHHYISEANKLIGKTCYVYNPMGSLGRNQYSYILENFELRYIKFRIVDNYIEINCHINEMYPNNESGDYITLRILPLSYEITYFND